MRTAADMANFSLISIAPGGLAAVIPEESVAATMDWDEEDKISTQGLEVVIPSAEK